MSEVGLLARRSSGQLAMLCLVRTCHPDWNNCCESSVITTCAYHRAHTIEEPRLMTCWQYPALSTTADKHAEEIEKAEGQHAITAPLDPALADKVIKPLQLACDLEQEAMQEACLGMVHKLVRDAGAHCCAVAPACEPIASSAQHQHLQRGCSDVHFIILPSTEAQQHELLCTCMSPLSSSASVRS